MSVSDGPGKKITHPYKCHLPRGQNRNIFFSFLHGSVCSREPGFSHQFRIKYPGSREHSEDVRFLRSRLRSGRHRMCSLRHSLMHSVVDFRDTRTSGSSRCKSLPRFWASATHRLRPGPKTIEGNGKDGKKVSGQVTWGLNSSRIPRPALLSPEELANTSGSLPMWSTQSWKSLTCISQIWNSHSWNT